MTKTDAQYNVLAVERILQDNPDGVTLKEITEKLAYEYGVKADRRAIWRNIDTLGWFFEIKKKKNSNHEYVYRIKR